MDLAAKLKDKLGRGFGLLGQGIQNDLYNGYFKNRPSSVVGNVILGKPWNQNIPDMGGMVSPLQSYTPQKIGRAIVPKAQAAAPQPTKAPIQPKKQVLAGTSTPAQAPDTLEKAIQQGLHDYSPNAPVATMAAAFAKAGRKMPKGNDINQLFPVLMSLIETSGGRNITRGQNNIYNMNANTGGSTYDTLETAILGGGPQQQRGFSGVMENPAYDEFRKTGNIADALKHLTPPDDNNATMERQLYRYNDLYNKYFKPYLK